LARVASDNQASENVGVNGAHVAPERPAGSRLSVIGNRSRNAARDLTMIVDDSGVEELGDWVIAG